MAFVLAEISKFGGGKIRELGNEKGRLHPLIRTMVRAGYTGGPGKKGVYDFWKEVLSKWQQRMAKSLRESFVRRKVM
jgi:hypothetical protein